MKLKHYMAAVLAVTLSVGIVPFAGVHASTVSWPKWVQELRAEAIGYGIKPELFDSVFSTIKAPSRKVLHYDRTQPERRITFLKYRNTRADAYRIRIGQGKLKKHNELLTQISNQYGVSPCFITSLWGLESSYGHFLGSFPVVQSLATLAYDSRRSAFFREQIFYALEILQGGHVSMKDFKGEWAGASGHPQFLPSSWHNFAVDYSGDGRKDIWGTKSDVFASIANYLRQHGWQTGQPWAIPVRLPHGFDSALLDRKITKPVAEWRQMGVRPAGRDWPASHLQASIIRPDGGPSLMIFNNFKVIMKWNKSTYYAGTVGYMAEQICRREL